MWCLRWVHTSQAWTYKKLGFPLPYLVVGRWGITPFPCRTALKFIVGAPISPPSPVPLGGEVRCALPCMHALPCAAMHASSNLHGTNLHASQLREADG